MHTQNQNQTNEHAADASPPGVCNQATYDAATHTDDTRRSTGLLCDDERCTTDEHGNFPPLDE